MADIWRCPMKHRSVSNFRRHDSACAPPGAGTLQREQEDAHMKATMLALVERATGVLRAPTIRTRATALGVLAA